MSEAAWAPEALGVDRPGQGQRAAVAGGRLAVAAVLLGRSPVVGDDAVGEVREVGRGGARARRERRRVRCRRRRSDVTVCDAAPAVGPGRERVRGPAERLRTGAATPTAEPTMNRFVNGVVAGGSTPAATCSPAGDRRECQVDRARLKRHGRRRGLQLRVRWRSGPARGATDSRGPAPSRSPRRRRTTIRRCACDSSTDSGGGSAPRERARRQRPRRCHPSRAPRTRSRRRRPSRRVASGESITGTGSGPVATTVVVAVPVVVPSVTRSPTAYVPGPEYVNDGCADGRVVELAVAVEVPGVRQPDALGIDRAAAVELDLRAAQRRSAASRRSRRVGVWLPAGYVIRWIAPPSKST